MQLLRILKPLENNKRR